ncbi:hypothetical protein Mapa_002882 [Marchantia paleacea]|nr:hypothetical protein Mapa_002882 [Marchantia paleacea]
MGSFSVTMQVSAFLLIVSTVITSVAAAPEAELVTNLPGLPTLGFKIYSGYVTVDEEHGRALFTTSWRHNSILRANLSHCGSMELSTAT